MHRCLNEGFYYWCLETQQWPLQTHLVKTCTLRSEPAQDKFYYDEFKWSHWRKASVHLKPILKNTKHFNRLNSCFFRCGFFPFQYTKRCSSYDGSLGSHCCWIGPPGSSQLSGTPCQLQGPFQHPSHRDSGPGSAPERAGPPRGPCTCLSGGLVAGNSGCSSSAPGILILSFAERPVSSLLPFRGTWNKTQTAC